METGLSRDFKLTFFKLKISIITAVFNRADLIAGAMKNIDMQKYKNIEHIVIDGNSIDGTKNIIQKLLKKYTVFISEPDDGIYFALNKGLKISSGEVIGFLHSDDFFSDENVLADVAMLFSDPLVDAVYGDLDYVSKKDTGHVVRHWRSGNYLTSSILDGWMPPHPALFLRRRVIEKWGVFDTRFRIAADYEAILRYFVKGKINSVYIPRVLVKMRIGGISNNSLINILHKIREDYMALKLNGVGGVRTLIFKNLSKVGQFF